MIGVQLRGRLGNQLFQYAFAYAASKRLGTTFYLDSRYQEWLLSKYFGRPSHYFSWLENYLFSIEGFRNFFSSYLKLGFYSKIRTKFKLEEIEISDQTDPNQELLSIADKKYYIGYFQSEAFFYEFKAEIIELFSIKKRFQKDFKAISDKLPKTSRNVVVHVRRSDYLDYNINLPIDYYHRAISRIADEINHYTFITDDYDYVNAEFSYVDNKYISKATEIIDFQFLMHADICIISNSTFSWWGAYLNSKKAQIIAPSEWFPEKGEVESPCNIVPKNWILIDYQH